MQPTTPRPHIHRLPVEILSNIFRRHVGLDPRDHDDFGADDPESWEDKTVRPVRLTHVCRTWRSSAIGDPALWTTVKITSSAELWTFILARSSPLPIDLIINLNSRFPNVEYEAQRIVAMLRTRFDESLASKERPTIPNRIRSLSITTEAMSPATTFTSFFEGYDLLALSGLYLCPVISESEFIYDALFRPLIRQSLTRLSLYNCCRLIRADGLRDIFTSCTSLEVLILGVLELDGRPSQLHTSTLPSTDDPKIYARRYTPSSSRHLSSSSTASTQIRPGNVGRHATYLEVAGAADEAIPRLTPLITRRASKPDTPPLALRISTCEDVEVGIDELERQILALLPNIHFHIYSDVFCSQECITGPFDDWIEKTYTTTFYLTNSAKVREELDWTGEHPLVTYPRLEPTRGLIPVVIHPTIGNPFLPEEGGTAEIPAKWYHNPETLDLKSTRIPVPDFTRLAGSYPGSPNSEYEQYNPLL